MPARGERPSSVRPILLAGLLVGLMLVLLAVPTEPATADAFAVAKIQPLKDVIDNLRDVIVALLVSVATLYLTIAGLRYMMAGGDPTQVERAKAAFRNAGIGYSLAV